MGTTWRPLALFVVAAVAVLTLAEVGARLLGPYLPEPLAWPDRTTQVKVRQMEALGCADVVFVGDSMARDGLAPDVVAASDPAGRRAYNASLDAATPAHLHAWVTDEVVPALDPSVVVLALSSFDVNRHNRAGASAEQAYRSSTGGDQGLTARLDEELAARSALWRYRTLLRTPSEVWEGFGRAVDGDRQPRDGPAGIEGLIGADGEGLSRAELRFGGESATTRFLTDELLGDFDLSDRQLASAETLVDDLHDDGVEVLLLVMPVTDEFVDLHPDGRRDVDAFRSAVTDLGDRTDAPVLDLLDRDFDDELFADTHHLNAAGAQRLTEEVVAALPEGPASCD